MSAPHDVLVQLLSPAQADTLDGIGTAAWATASAALKAVFGSVAGLEDIDGRLVMPDEIVDEFKAPHLVAPLEVSTNQEQTALAYIVVTTSEAAAALGSQADDASDEEQQTIVVASTILGQVIQSLNTKVFGVSPAGLVLSMDDLGANSMPALLAAMDEPALALAGTLTGSGPLRIKLILPGTFLDIVAGAMAAGGVDSAERVVAVEDHSPFSLTEEEIAAAELIEEDDLREPVFAGATPSGAPLRREQGPREPTPIANAPAAQRARFVPLPEAPATGSRSRIDLLAGLQMNVTVELGRTEMTVADVLGLGPGSVVELDRLAGEPVDILVNDRLIARGEVVVVDENFGVRVVEVVRRASEQEERVS